MSDHCRFPPPLSTGQLNPVTGVASSAPRSPQSCEAQDLPLPAPAGSPVSLLGGLYRRTAVRSGRRRIGITSRCGSLGSGRGGRLLATIGMLYLHIPSALQSLISSKSALESCDWRRYFNSIRMAHMVNLLLFLVDHAFDVDLHLRRNQ